MSTNVFSKGTIHYCPHISHAKHGVHYKQLKLIMIPSTTNAFSSSLVYANTSYFCCSYLSPCLFVKSFTIQRAECHAFGWNMPLTSFFKCPKLSVNQNAPTKSNTIVVRCIIKIVQPKCRATADSDAKNDAFSKP